MKFKGAIFDLDGVIVDSVPLHYEAWHRLFADDHHITFNKKIYEEIVDGKPRLDSIRALLPNLTDAEIVAEGAKKNQYYLDMLEAGKLKKFDDAFELIDNLVKNEILLAAASSSKNAKNILEKIGLIDIFKVIVSGDDIKYGKPNPEIFLLAAQKLELSPPECVVFEDSLAGVSAAKAGGFLCVGIDRHNHPEYYQKADLRVTNLTEVNYINLNQIFDHDPNR
jgi:beta-phosphoglucomutase